ncbi:MAG: OmpA family protein [Bacteroidota bacterium]|nr:OmpA family protein [Bacteroidota bacterium]
MFAQRVQWATKLVQKSEMYQTQWNYPELVLGPPSIYPDRDINAPLPDLYSDGYILMHDKTKSEVIEMQFDKPMPANELLIYGILNDGTIKSAHIILKDHKSKKVYTAPSEPNLQKKMQIKVNFNLETVYGAKITIDHSKINVWNLVKGIGVHNGNDSIQIIPDLYPQAEFPFGKDTIGHNINTHECFEFNPRISPDGSTMYFVKECPGVDDQDIWFAESDAAGKWKPAQSIGSPLNNQGHNFVTSISMDGRTLYIGNTYRPDGQQLGSGISVSKLQKNKTWSLPENIEIPELNNQHTNGNYFMSLDGSAVLIAMQNQHSEGELDLYVSLYNKYRKKYEEPINLGHTINTPFTEDYPYLAFDNKTLYFSSKGHVGYGGHDIYMSRRLDDSWTKWTKPVNLGPKINSKTDDDGFMIANSGDVAYFNSVAFDTIHNMDIYRIKLPKLLEQQAQVLIKGKVTSLRNNKPLSANIRYKEKGKKNFEPITVQTDEDGNFSFILPHGKAYDIDVETPSYFKMTDHISLLDTNMKSHVLKKFALEPFLDSGQVSVLSNLLFDFGTAKLKDTSFHELEKMAKKLHQQNKSVIEIAGHTDDVGPEEYNLTLSQERATAVVNYLVSKGIRPWRLKAKGYGENMPIAANDSEDGRTLNRRVEMIILDDDFTKKYNKPKNDKKQRFNFYSNVARD